MSEQGAGGRGVIECHYCQRPVSFSTGTPTHLDLTPMCSQGNVTRWIEREIRESVAKLSEFAEANCNDGSDWRVGRADGLRDALDAIDALREK